ncbi:hypothetical protein XCM_21050 [Xanthomonas citri pv. mangiferaeindicae]|nr:hypothetical protein XCM_21050 [Xanthomonas citri pv. mangiferaeindicae]
MRPRAEAFRRALQVCIWGGTCTVLARASSVPPHELAYRISATDALAAERQRGASTDAQALPVVRPTPVSQGTRRAPVPDRYHQFNHLP